MALRVRKFSSAEDMALFLQGAVVGGGHGGNINGLVGKTLVFTRPVATVTFVQGVDPSGVLTFSEVQTQIQAAVAAIKVRRVGYEGKIVLSEVTPTNGIALNNGSTARSILGFGTGVDTKVYAAPGGTSPTMVTAYYDTNSNGHILVTSE